jgi:hypothetical protein
MPVSALWIAPLNALRESAHRSGASPHERCSMLSKRRFYEGVRIPLKLRLNQTANASFLVEFIFTGLDYRTFFDPYK